MGTRERDEGFTLIELLVVIVIIGILAAIAIPSYLRHREKAYRAQAVHDMKNAALAMETFATDNATFSYAGLDGATESTPAIQAEGFRPSDWVSLTVSATDTSYCIEGQNQFVPGKTFVYRSDSGIVQIGLNGLVTC
ncbi:MAG TPA: prepilin-type N-terminal cleavage/methylation domain-containing protein [Frankiaceae bacterium]|nr:prepilin-type N-terminal cleavage/methylation domain-containing protein [Frankiaceae bacterium]